MDEFTNYIVCMKKILSTLLITLALTQPAYSMTIKEGEFVIRAISNDPESVVFKGVFIHGHYMCGQMKQKNQFGAYTGYQTFYMKDDSTEYMDSEGVHSFGGADIFMADWNKKCR